MSLTIDQLTDLLEPETIPLPEDEEQQQCNVNHMPLHNPLLKALGLPAIEGTDACSITPVALLITCQGMHYACQTWVDFWNENAVPTQTCADCHRFLFDCWSVTPL